jgi:hypothetical protein
LAAALIAALFVVAGPADATGINGKINFVSARTGDREIWSMTSTGSSQLQLTNDPALDDDPAPSPDGKFTAFSSDRDGNFEIYRMKTNGATETRLTTTAEDEEDPAFSSDSTKITFVRSTGAFDSDIWVMNADGTGQTQVTSEVELEYKPSFSPDGAQIAFEREGNVWITSLDGNTQSQLTTGGGFEPAFMPDGRIVYRATNEIHVMDADGTNHVNLTNHPAFDGDPSPSPDGTKIAFTTFRNGDFDIFVMDADGSNQTNLTLLSIDDVAPAWGSIDTSFPSTTITGPGSRTMDTTPTFTFEADEEATFECSLHADGAAATFSSCTSPVTASPALTPGAYVFEVRATDVDSNVEDPPAAETFTVDLTPPTASADGDDPTNDTTPTLTFSFNEPVQSAATQCSLVASGSPDSFASCSSPFTSPTTLGAGDYAFKVKGTDIAGNVGSATSFPFSIDLTPPDVTINGPALTNDTTPEFTFSFTETPASGTTECSLRPTGSSDSFAACSSPYVHGTVLGDGPYTFKVRANDAAGNTGTGSHSVTIDATGPTATIDGDDLTNDPTPEFTFSFNESLQANSTECSLVASGSSDSFSTCSSPYAHGVSLADGDYVFKVRASDQLGNAGTAASFPFELDIVGPTASINGAPLTNDNTPDFTFSFNEAIQPGLTQCSLVPEGSPDSFASCSSPYTSTTLADGDHVFKVRGTDVAGNVGPVASFDFAIDSGGPQATITGPTVTNDTTPSFEFSFNETTQSGTTQCSFRLTSQTNSFSSCVSPFTQPTTVTAGEYIFKVRATDMAGNSATTSHTVTIDTTNPTVTINGAAATADNTPEFSFSFSETVASSVCSVQPTGQPNSYAPCTSPFTATTLADGVYDFKVRATDPAGNQGPAATLTFTVDTTGPVAVITGPTATNDTTPTFGYTFSETIVSSTRECSLQPSGQPDAFASCSTSYTAPSALADGDHVFTVRASDQLGNVGSTTHAVTVDGAAPTVTVTDGPASSTTDTTPAFTFTTDDSVTIRCSLTLAGSGNNYNDCTSPYESAPLTDGTYEFKVRGTDPAGNIASTTYAFTLDTQGPSVTITGADQTTDTTPTFSFSFNESVDPSTVECSLVPEGSPNAYSLCTSPFTAPSPLAEGSYNFKVRADDVLGNSGNPSTKVFVVDGTPPIVVITGKTKTRDATPKFTFTTTETVTYECSMDTKPFASCGSPYTSKRLKPKKHTLHVQATDLAGNVGPVTDFVFKVRR